MGEGEVKTEQRLDELYREPPGGFVAGRNRLAKELRDAGERDEAERVKGLRRPTVAAWLINRAVLTSPPRREEFAEASRKLEAAQGRALEGEDEGAAEWRAAAAREREATDAVLETAERAARDAGHPPSATALEQAGRTLRAATGDPELRELVVAGRLERERSAATLGTPAGPPPARQRGAARKRGAAQARRELERLERELAEAKTREERLRSQAEQAAEILHQDKAKLAEGKRETAALERQVKAARRRAR